MTARHPTLIAVATLLASAVLAPPALAEVERPSQGKASNGLFLSYAPAPDDEGAVCFVDSGIDENPDTEDGIIERESVAGDGASGEDSGDRHGTSMAMVAGAPRNGWGMVGAWDRLGIVGVRAADEDGDFPFERYRTAIATCRELKEDGRPIKAIVLALGGSRSPDDADLARLEDTIDQARDDGINVVAAAGNDDEDEAVYPARVDDVLGVGASRADGGRCGFSNHGVGVDLYAPGCDLDVADPRSGDEEEGNGTSHASAIVAATIAALRSYDEDLDVDEAEEIVLESADNGALDVEAAFRRAGLDEVVEAGEDAIPESDGGGDDGDADSHGGGGGSGREDGGGGSGSSGGGDDAVALAPPAPPLLSPLPAPAFTHSLRRGVLTVRVHNRPPGARVTVTLYARGSEFGARPLRRLVLGGGTLRRRVPRFARIVVSFASPGLTSTETVRRR